MADFAFIFQLEENVESLSYIMQVDPWMCSSVNKQGYAIHSLVVLLTCILSVGIFVYVCTTVPPTFFQHDGILVAIRNITDETGHHLSFSIRLVRFTWKWYFWHTVQSWHIFQYWMEQVWFMLLFYNQYSLIKKDIALTIL